MVQRKVPNKLGINADPIKAIKQIVNHKSSSLPSQNHDIKNRGADLKKKMMKKSGKTKLSEYGICHSPNFRKHLPQPGKPPPLVHSTPKKQQQQQQQSTSSPNYMKSTSSSAARKEQSQVSSWSLQAYSNSSKSKLGSANSVNKPTRSLARNASLKLVRTTLTKTPSFKPVRVSAKKSCPPPIVLCENFPHLEKATCSSTLKEAKFPSYLELSPGGTESDGSSVFKVCPYTYCSLNGHHHPPLPPLKCFMSARRRTLKTQRNFKLGCLSPRRANPHGLSLNENVPKQKLNTAEVAPLTNEDDKEFFVEIYSKEREEIADTIGRNTNAVDDYNTDDSSATDLGRQHPGDDTEDNLDQKREAISADINIPGSGPADNLNEEIYMPPMVHEGGDVESLSTRTGLEIEDTAEELESEASYMDWDEEKYYAYSEDEMDSIPNDTEPITLADDSVVSEEFMAKSSIPELLSDNILDESSDEESIISATCYDYGDSESACSCTEFGIDECVEASEDTSNNSLDVNFILDGEITEKSEDEHVEAVEIFYLEDEISTSLQDDDEIALIGYQEENVCSFGEVQDETFKDDEKSSDGNIVVKMEDAETKTDCCEQGNENCHGNNDAQLVVTADLKSKTTEDNTSYPAEDRTAVVEADTTAEACAEEVNQIKDAPRFEDKKTREKNYSSEELSESYRNLRGTRRINIEEPEESREFNPRPPNFLPVEPDPESEKVNLKQQLMDDRKNAEDWMLDFALQRAVDNLAPARKRKVALLVEAFETVMPTSKWEPHLRRSSAGFGHPRSIQACS